MASSREQAAAMELAGYGSKEAPIIDDQELGSEGAGLARIERVYKYVISITSSTTVSDIATGK